MQKYGQVEIVGTAVDAVNLDAVVMQIEEWVEQHQRAYIACGTVHSLMTARTDSAHREALANADLVTPDGMPLVWLCQRAGHSQCDRVYGPDLLEAVLRHPGAKSWRHYFLGGAPGVAEKMVARLQLKYPHLIVAGIHSPPFRELSDAENATLQAEIESTHPDILWVGLGAPKQEKWMAAHRAAYTVPVMIGIGAAFDFFAGNKPHAPRWMQRSGLEWFFRLCCEPRRLWRRYLLLNPLFVLICAKERLWRLFRPSRGR